ncbi:hypothetical protein GCK72_013226 [Caenorhabditis remanei]|uniref:Uncharacterized protein n=1 Tax=Caenorhabditis remanei TaxID=31234 RepID=A0A6A5GQW9_CAERE|nr:hypothetical protein GCK72_013226 [Caenorhabditis remanei]KAF1756772.1 hypothetical protein GCK72_013226 [Caenorhabditis remanei]
MHYSASQIDEQTVHILIDYEQANDFGRKKILDIIIKTTTPLIDLALTAVPIEEGKGLVGDRLKVTELKKQEKDLKWIDKETLEEKERKKIIKYSEEVMKNLVAKDKCINPQGSVTFLIVTELVFLMALGVSANYSFLDYLDYVVSYIILCLVMAVFFYLLLQLEDTNESLNSVQSCLESLQLATSKWKFSAHNHATFAEVKKNISEATSKYTKFVS